MTKLERITEFYPAYDKRNPDPRKNYGIHGVDLRMVVKGEKGAYQFVLYTDWQLPHVQEELRAKGKSFGPLPADVGYHAREPQYDGQTPMSDSCEYLDGSPCYYDGSGLAAEDMFALLVSQGSDAVWAKLEQLYVERFETEVPQ